MTCAPSGRRAIAFAACAAAVALHAGTAAAADMNAVNHAGQIASSVVVGSAAPSLGVGAVLQTLVGLALVIGLVFGCAWLARRFGFQPAGRGGPLKVVSSVAVGTKERATIVEIGDTWLVLGVAPGNVRLLHTLPAGSAAAMAPDAPAGAAPSSAGGSLSGTFGQRFRSALAGEAAKRLGRDKDR
ncbi:flagellar biosynthesis protein FliO [Burkholderia stagnalis]|uniref:flagellar biosynthetic protein FliO n=1 Tax=Burkholderia stagnalis TaxID=1503054 RepID=UPI0007548783|nr:flagellar biosynthetic protein FliO [Burkholderia stagnalis]AOK51307.1 flagellar biosynthesis protein FliO [Burkholderia stagnalis]KVN73579.1 flagellar biosynthesis protein FliO [Burkholderia stagnalis]KWO32891.1 flagellar biosynthesis protein FliO [Burkholderia stagnalis]KWO33794.1 flagellar biosynthesis protein FliO [Burkholderia stagnalis]MDY7807065.1 flagellar biosynthetic protein FliO [Burkholderia stagnalis]